MMKKVIGMLLLLIGVSAMADDIRLYDGNVISNVRVVSQNSDSLSYEGLINNKLQVIRLRMMDIETVIPKPYDEAKPALMVNRKTAEKGIIQMSAGEHLIQAGYLMRLSTAMSVVGSVVLFADPVVGGALMAGGFVAQLLVPGHLMKAGKKMEAQAKKTRD